ncbi:hypothetical protein ABPG74_013642 [Tetrahymena malaccensis]
MFKPSFLALSRIFIILIGMIKAGYSLMLFNNFIDVALFYKYLGTFFAGSTLILSFQKGLSRNLILLFAEILYILMMIIIPFTSNDFRIYGFLFCGGFCFLLYPMYSNENLLQADQRKSTVVSWIFLGLGAVYYFWLTYHYQPKYSFETNVVTIISILQTTDQITPYVFGSFSVMNVLLILLQKGKETLFFYRYKQDKEMITELSGILYNSTYKHKINQEFSINDIESTSSLLLHESGNQIHLNKKEKLKYLITMIALAFLIGCQSPFNGLIINVLDFLLIIQDQYDYFELKITFGYCFLYQLIIITAVLIGIYLIHKQRKAILFIQIVIILILNFIFLGYDYKSIFTDSDFQALEWFSVIFMVFKYGGLGSMIFTQPFLTLKVHEILVYFMFLWIGKISSYEFAKNSINDDHTMKYPSEILNIVTIFVAIIPLAYLKFF